MYLSLREVAMLHNDIHVGNTTWNGTWRIGHMRGRALDIQIDSLRPNA